MFMPDWAGQAIMGKVRHVPCPFCRAQKKCMAIGASLTRVWCYCHRCGHTSQVSRQASADDRQAILAGQQWQNQKAIALPNDATHILPVESRLWLYKASISAETAHALGFMYSKRLHRTLLPMYADDKLVYCIARAHAQGPKYLTQASAGFKFFRVYNTCISQEQINANAVCVVEDALSAVRVGKYLPCYALQGLQSQKVLQDIITQNPFVHVWLDPDTPGQIGAKAFIRQLRMYNISYRNIVSTKDPKNHTNADIEQYLQIP